MGCNCKRARRTERKAKSYNILDAASDVLKNALGIDDDVFAPKDIAQSRLQSCLECEKLVRATKQCRLCGCFVVAKTKMHKASCPLGKWGAES
ncbi:MAG: hypothetical protein K2M51_02075 [Helicobacter sp.]|nr:hypothetical protein [Helicobacter sp.]